MLKKASSFFPALREMGVSSLKVESEPFPDALARIIKFKKNKNNHDDDKVVVLDVTILKKTNIRIYKTIITICM